MRSLPPPVDLSGGRLEFELTVTDPGNLVHTDTVAIDVVDNGIIVDPSGLGLTAYRHSSSNVTSSSESGGGGGGGGCFVETAGADADLPLWLLVLVCLIVFVRLISAPPKPPAMQCTTSTPKISISPATKSWYKTKNQLNNAVLRRRVYNLREK